ncbi:hypothetical protein BDZ97DRAFT_1922099 [Flammula alnicola]|nr:hypothetical protein BDZ97DRAFT_1922099 [Flammula alnicola]
MNDREQNDSPLRRPPHRGHHATANTARTHTCTTNPRPDAEVNTNGTRIFDLIEAVLVLYTTPVAVRGFWCTILVLVQPSASNSFQEVEAKKGQNYPNESLAPAPCVNDPKLPLRPAPPPDRAIFEVLDEDDNLLPTLSVSPPSGIVTSNKNTDPALLVLVLAPAPAPELPPPPSRLTPRAQCPLLHPQGRTTYRTRDVLIREERQSYRKEIMGAIVDVIDKKRKFRCPHTAFSFAATQSPAYAANTPFSPPRTIVDEVLDVLIDGVLDVDVL